MHTLSIEHIFTRYFPYEPPAAQDVRPHGQEAPQGEDDITIVTAFFDIGRGKWGAS